ncbi:SDR family oxidoreductase [Cryobacterium tepidiphilum]|uniref:SDR family NAD(P)-dependent oxidoreductase n=1 Tax=Cryobacterium tepidiphilum TaxID=2486026 RepID=A0A3M8LEW0_9MICO|nr:SDR family oxidoreductase [Cryobacterium tepidiphilum]RNE64026.1 SDR family NAD(P)-dependent oxidoreductase [Cryobacterium tepidiphilum]
MSRKNRVVVITGASSGIGRATALHFAADGDCVVLASRRRDALEEVAGQCEELGVPALVVPTDVTDADAVDALAAAAVARFGRIDVWVNAAGVSVFAEFVQVPLDDFRRVIDVNLMGYVYGSRAALIHMGLQGRGVLVNVASVLGEVPQPYTAAYGMSKAAVRALGVTLRSELQLRGLKHVHVSTVLPATIDTPFFRHAANYTGRKVLAMPPVYGPGKVARTIVGLAKDPRDEVAVGAFSKATVREHRRHPASVEWELAALTDKAQLSPHTPAPDTSGNLYAPPDDVATITGGWAGTQRMRLRTLLGWALLGGGAVAVWKAARRR